MRLLKWLFAIALVIYGCILLAFFLFQTRLFYFPPNRPLESCNLPNGVEIFDEAGMRGLFTKGGDKLLIFFHGNAESACSWRFLGVNHAARFGYDVLVLEYPGYEDESQPSKARMDEMRENLTDWWRTQSYSKTVLMGLSLGTGIASEASQEIEADAIILFAPYDRMLNVARDHAGFLPLPSFVLKEDYDALSALRGYENTLVLVHGAEDAVIRPKRSEAIAAEMPQAVRIELENTGHNGLFETDFLDPLLAEYLP